MAKSIQEERLRWVLPIVRKEIRIVDVVKVCPHSERSLKRWLATYRAHGAKGLIPQSTAPKTNPKETEIRLKERVIEVRNQTKKCALKIHWQLEKEGFFIHERTIGKILKTEGLVKKYRVKRVKYKYLKVQRQPGELFEIDVKYVPSRIAGQRYFQYTAIDTASRWRYLKIFEDQSNYHSIEFVKEVISLFPYPIRAIKTDNGSVFTNYYLGTNKRSDQTVKTIHPLDHFCAEQTIVHYLIDPGKPAQNGRVERSHREDQQKFYERHKFRTANDLKKKIKVWNDQYNNLEHCGLNGKTPNEMLGLIKVTNVCA